MYTRISDKLPEKPGCPDEVVAVLVLQALVRSRMMQARAVADARRGASLACGTSAAADTREGTVAGQSTPSLVHHSIQRGL